MKTSIKKVSPAMAKKWLEKNENNRNVSIRTVSRYAKEMQNGGWKSNGDPIRFDTDGNILDGQHRLLAIVKADKAAELLVVEDLPREVFDTIDIGKRRSAADCLGIIGTDKSPQQVAAAIRAITLYERKGLYMSNTVNSQVENREITARFNIEPAMVTEIYNGLGFPMVKRLMTPSLAGAFFYLLGKKDADKRDEFFIILDSGNAGDARHPILVLRERLIRDRTGGTRPMQNYMANLATMGWNAFREGRRIANIKASTLPEALKIQ